MNIALNQGLAAHGLTLAYGARQVVQGLDLTLPAGRVTAILGPNGCGKSTLLKGLARLIRPQAGRVTLDGADLLALPSRGLARRLAILPQSPLAPEGITVRDLVARGRAPWRGLLAPWNAGDAAAVARAMAATGVDALAGEPVATLSGGQRQRVWIALTLAQDTGHILLDEPTTWLDLPHQIEVLTLLRRLNRDDGRSVVMVLHDLNLAARYADHLVLMAGGRVLAEGAPAVVITPTLLLAAFGLRARVLDDPVTGTPMVVPE